MKRNKPNFKIKTLFFAITFATAALSGCGGSSSPVATLPPEAPPVVSPVKWEVRESVSPVVKGNYLSVVKNSDSYDIYSNFNGSDNTRQAKLYKYSGKSLDTMQIPVVDLDIQGKYLRTIGLQKDTDGTIFAILRVSDGPYGSGSYYPYFAKKDTNGKWSYVDKKLWLGNSNSNTLIVNPDDFSPPSPQLQDQKFVVYDDSFGVKIALAASINGLDWNVLNVGGKPKELLPSEKAKDNPQFMSAVKTPNATHIIYANWSNSEASATNLVHLYSENGEDFCVLDSNSATMNGAKGTTLYYDADNKEVHAVTNGKHLAFKDQKFSCPK